MLAGAAILGMGLSADVLAEDKTELKETKTEKKVEKKAEAPKASTWKFDQAARDSLRHFYKQYPAEQRGLPSGLLSKVQEMEALPSGWRDKLKPGWKIDEAWMQRLIPISLTELPADFAVGNGIGVYLLGDRILRVDEEAKSLIDSVRISSIKLK